MNKVKNVLLTATLTSIALLTTNANSQDLDISNIFDDFFLLTRGGYYYCK